MVFQILPPPDEISLICLIWNTIDTNETNETDLVCLIGINGVPNSPTPRRDQSRLSHLYQWCSKFSYPQTRSVSFVSFESMGFQILPPPNEISLVCLISINGVPNSPTPQQDQSRLSHFNQWCSKFSPPPTRSVSVVSFESMVFQILPRPH